MDYETSQPETLQTTETTENKEDNQKQSTPEIKIRKKGRQKTIIDIKQYHKERYQQQKEKIKEIATESQKRYRDAYKLLVKIIEEDISIPDDVRLEAIKIISV